MRFVAGLGALLRRASGKILLARGAAAESHRESAAGRYAVAKLHREANKRTQKEKGPEETLISLPSHFYLLPCERATRHATRPNRRSPLACSAGMHCRRSCRRHSPLAFTAGIQCRHSVQAFSAGELAARMPRWRSCRCNYAGIARKVAANARIA